MSNTMRRRLCVLAFAAALIALVSAAYFHWRGHSYDALIVTVAGEYELPAELVRAIIKRESGFNHRCKGKAGEIGLMQVMPSTAKDWANNVGRTNFHSSDLYRPEINLRAGCWYLNRARQYWSKKSNPLPYMLAEYNAGRSNAQRWASNDRDDPNIFWQNITYPATKRYVKDIISDYRRRH